MSRANESQSRGIVRAPAGSGFLPRDPSLAFDSEELLALADGKVIDLTWESPQPAGKSVTAEGAGSSEDSWSEDQLRHLLSRASFGSTVAEVQSLMSLGKDRVLDVLFAEDPIPVPPGDWVEEPLDRDAYRTMSPQQREAWLMRNRDNIIDLVTWLFRLMVSSPLNLRERMTWFWHGLFTSDFRVVPLAQVHYIQDETWRRHALGNFGDFLKAMYRDPAMLVYLNGIQNDARQPNENFARELLELFTMGSGTTPRRT